QVIRCTGYATRDVIQYTLPRPFAGVTGNIVECHGPSLFGQCLGQADGLDVRYRVHWLPPRTPSTALINGLPLLVERTNTFSPILRWNHAIIRFNLKHQSAAQIHVQSDVHGLLELAGRNWRVSRDDLSGVQRTT